MFTVVYIDKEHDKNMDRYKKKMKEIKDFLKSKGVLEDVDTTLIDELVFNLRLSDTAKKEVFPDGQEPVITVNIREIDKQPYYVANPAIKIYNEALKTIRSISISLGLTPADRKKLGLQDKKEEEDALDKILS